jgi:protein TonB
LIAGIKRLGPGALILLTTVLVACKSTPPPTSAKPAGPPPTSPKPAGPPPDPLYTRPVWENAACRKLEPPVRISGRQPDYQVDLRRNGIEGTVVLQAMVAQDGAVKELKVVESPNALLTDQAFDAVRDWRFRPALCDGKPIAVYITATSSFKSNR